VPALIEALSDENGAVRLNAVIALGKINRPTKTVVPALIEALQDDSEWVREYVAEALKQVR
jgi:HEAT repeat protein